jgi:ABC-type bacteriocin/lantibiotic exporter with double-glycine peptidase domain
MQLICLALLCLIPFVFSCGPAIKQTKPVAQNIKLVVPYEPNLGNTCFSSCFAMVMRYWNKDVHVQDIVKIVGLPPFHGYDHQELNSWMAKNYNLRFKYLPNSTIDDIKIYLSEGYPIIVHQTMSFKDTSGHNRVVIGYDDNKNVFITNDPSRFGLNYEIPYSVFKDLWSNIALIEKGPVNKAYLVYQID